MRAVGKKISEIVKAWSGCKNTYYQQKLFKILLLIFDRTTGKILVKDFGSEKQLQTVEKFRILCWVVVLSVYSYWRSTCRKNGLNFGRVEYASLSRARVAMITLRSQYSL